MSECPECDHLREIIDERDRRYQERYEASGKAVEAALLAAKEAVIKAELSADKRFELLNELRTGVATTDQVEALEKIVGELASRITRAEGKGAGIGAMYGWIITAVGAIVGIMTVVIIATR
jgi:phosphopantetheinyl transferase (holo-ACP synthase)